MRTINDLKLGASGSVVKLHGEGPLKRRIMDMGITKGVNVRVKRVAPFGDPIELTVRGYQLSIRKEDAATIEISEPNIQQKKAL